MQSGMTARLKLSLSHRGASPAHPNATLARSSPSPPPASRRLSHSARNVRPTRSSLVVTSRNGATGSSSTAIALDWSTSYQASASSGADAFYESSTATEDDDSEPETARGRAHDTTHIRLPTLSPSRSIRLQPVSSSSVLRARKGSEGAAARKMSGSLLVDVAPGSPRSSTPNSIAAPVNGTSEAIPTLLPPRSASPVALIRPATSALKQTKPRQLPAPRTFVTLLPTACRLRVNVPCTRLALDLNLDIRAASEAAILLGTVYLACTRLALFPEQISAAVEIYVIVALSLLYLFASHILSMLSTPPAAAVPANATVPPPSPLPPIQVLRRSGRERRLSLQIHSAPAKPRSLGVALLWMTEPTHYRECSDDGLLSGTLLPLIVSAAGLYSTCDHLRNTPDEVLPFNWRVEAPLSLPTRPDGTNPPGPLQSLVYARQSLVQISTLCSAILLVHTAASRWREHRYIKDDKMHERLPRSNGRRVIEYIKFGVLVSLAFLAVKTAFVSARLPVWQDLTLLEVGVVSTFHQFALYLMIRLARRGFTYGELGMVGQIATGMFMMTFNLTAARLWPITTPYIKTFTLPTPLTIFQVALIPGSFVTGFLLSPLLALSRHMAQRPIRRLRFPDDRMVHRRALAAGFYLGVALIVGGMIGMWTRWCLRGRDPWIWAVMWLLQGRRPWSRPALLAYWGLLGTLSVAGWNRQLARLRRFKHLRQRGDQSASEQGGPPTTSTSTGVPREAPTNGNGNVSGDASDSQQQPSSMVDRASGAATELLDAADKRVPTLGLNARRKFFHALAVIMFVPGIAVDPAFTHLSFSAAFSLFTFAEYVRYFALYPFGATVHVFLSEFLDHKDSGTAILSHFYLLTGCAIGLWLEGSSRILEYTGVLSLGVGDAMASIVGKRIGRRRWSAASGKTVEGSLAFVGSVVACAVVLRALGVAEAFSIWRYGVVCAAGGLLEALSVQNDNLTLPLLMWSVGTLWL